MKDLEQEELYEDAIKLLKSLIETPSFSKEEHDSADLLQKFLQSKGVKINRKGNNIWASPSNYSPTLPNILLNSHHDTVKPNAGYTKDPFTALENDGKLYGLGSNDAGGCLVSLIATFIYFYQRKLPFNLWLAATAEEEISGKHGIESILGALPTFELAIVGEPTLMQMAVAEKGLMVIDAEVKGKAGHAAREEGENALYKAIDDLAVIRQYKFKKTSPFLGESKVTATVIKAGNQHNVIPDRCQFTLDVRVTDAYTLGEALEELKAIVKAELKPRSMRLQSSKLPGGHLAIKVAKSLNIEIFGSPTLSDQALIPYNSIKMGPGYSARSHTPDEFIYLDEIKKGIQGYIAFLQAYADEKK
jgi:acetylornithine deacetylase